MSTSPRDTPLWDLLDVDPSLVRESTGEEPVRLQEEDDDDLTFQLPVDEQTLQLRQQVDEKSLHLHKAMETLRQYKQDFDAVQARVDMEVESRLHDRMAHLLDKLLTVKENLDRSLMSAMEGGDVRALVDGVTMVAMQFNEALVGLGVHELRPDRERFDPMYHEAVAVVPAPSPELSGMVSTVVQTGFCTPYRLIRPAKVVVFK